MHVNRDDLLDAVSHDVDYCSISKPLQETMDTVEDFNSEAYANVVRVW